MWACQAGMPFFLSYACDFYAAQEQERCARRFIRSSFVDRATGTLAGQGSSNPVKAKAAPAKAKFLEKLIMSAIRWLGSSTFQKSCMVGDTPKRKVSMAATPSFGFTPKTMLVPPEINNAPVAATAMLAAGIFFAAAYCDICLRFVK